MRVRGVWKYGDRYESAEIEIPESIQPILEQLKYTSIFVKVEKLTIYKRYSFVIDIENENDMYDNINVLKKYVPELKVCFAPNLYMVFAILSV